MSEFDRLGFEIRKLQVAAGDVVVVRVADRTPRREIDELVDVLDRALPDGARGLITPYDVSNLGALDDEIAEAPDPDELVRWAEMYGHPEGWAKRAQAAHIRAERAEAELAALRESRGQFTDLGVVGPVSFQGGIIVLQGNGCRGCGNGFWTEADNTRRLATGAVHHCPHCGQRREVTS